MARRLVREKALQTLYQYEMNPGMRERVVAKEADELKPQVSPDDLSFFKRLTEGVIRHQEKLDEVIQGYLRNDWTISRLPSLDRIILRMALVELVFEEEIPYGVTLNEAVDLAKTFSTEESRKFINGVLASMVKEMETIRKSFAGEDA
ncbi:N utilization substance protein B [Marinithermofilum abyssi]|uniref:Transcription antitermination protein NusB n=1 Tax=Marinithermofilum abyssi TaxID=1571185 RepID=A0A8J2YAB5_9BACL|nr:transcription antitermination factor NusB [Marinithermofilum abyssi]GGE10374.1 N utilization substance protein B [Marinithermofilum abyssi]